MIVGGKSKYVNLFVFIKHESRKLHDIIEDLGLAGTFRSTKFQNTFLIPGAKLVKYIEDLVEQNEDVKAIDLVRSLLLRGHLNLSDFKKGANIGTLQFGSYVLADPEEVCKNIADSKKEIIVTRDNAYATIVFNYKGDEAPKTVKGKSGGLVPVTAKFGSGVNEDAEVVRALTKELIVRDSVNTTIKIFFRAVTAVLDVLSLEDQARYKRAKFYLAAILFSRGSS